MPPGELTSTFKAYLIVVCDRETHQILGVYIWSSPEWEQSRQLPQITYVAYQLTSHTSFQDGINRIEQVMQEPNSRYGYLLPHYQKAHDYGYLLPH